MSINQDVNWRMDWNVYEKLGLWKNINQGSQIQKAPPL